MILTYQNILSNVNKINGLLSGKRQVQRIYSTSRYICFSIRVTQQTLHIYLGRGKGHEGIWLGEKPPVVPLRKIDKFLEILRRYVRNSNLMKVEIDSKDRIISFKIRKGNLEQSFYFSWFGRNSYFIVSNEKNEILLSWKAGNWIKKDNSTFDLFDEVGRKDISKDTSSKDISIDELLMKEFSDYERGMSTKKIIKKEERKKIKIQNDIQKLNTFIGLQADLIAGKFDHDITKARTKMNLEGVKIVFWQADTIHQRKDLIFHKMKAIKKAIIIQSKRLEQCVNKKYKDEIINNLVTISPIWNVIKSKAPEVIGKYKVYDFEHCSIGVGLSAQGNDEMRAKWASKEDIWVHLAEGTSAHAIIKLKQASEIHILLEKAALIIQKYSKPTGSEVDIVYTKVKDLKSVKGTAGLVRYKKEKHMRIIFE
jgi:predicted ribosome quality control (RQC) complex YloA/Tae2 family protein